MMPETETESTILEELLNKSKAYLNTRIELIKLKVIKKVSDLLLVIFFASLLGIIAVLIIVLFSIGLSMYLGKVLGSIYLGFFIVGAFYILTGAFLIIFRKKLIQAPLSNWLIRNLLD